MLTNGSDESIVTMDGSAGTSYTILVKEGRAFNI